MKPHHSNIEELTLVNNNFRQVIYTGPKSQLVLMSLKPGEDIGVETHGKVDQFFRVEAGEGKAIIGGVEYALADATAVIVPAGSEHNFINTGSSDLKMYTIYTPPNHIDGRVHTTKADAIADVEDEAFGETVV